MIETIDISCPYCGEPFNTSVDCSAGDQDYIEDCHVCCQPIEFTVIANIESGLENIEVKRNDE